MIKNFKVTVNGNIYDVSVEELSQQSAPVAAAPPVSSPQPSAPIAAPPAAAPPTSGQKVSFPMPGTVLDVLVTAGQTVEKNQVVAILEAMKMENEIVTPYAGTVVSVNTAKGSSVNTGDLILIVG